MDMYIFMVTVFINQARYEKKTYFILSPAYSTCRVLVFPPGFGISNPSNTFQFTPLVHTFLLHSVFVCVVLFCCSMRVRVTC